MTARRSFDVAGKIAFVLWRHGQRRNGTMPTMKVASLCLLSHRSAWIPYARSPSRIERSRTRLPVGVRSLMCEKIEFLSDSKYGNYCVKLRDLRWVEWLFNVTFNDISDTYVTPHRCSGRLKKKFDLQSGYQCHRHSVWFCSMPVQAPTRGHPFYGYSKKPPNFSRLLWCAWGYRGPILVWIPQGHNGGCSYAHQDHKDDFLTPSDWNAWERCVYCKTLIIRVTLFSRNHCSSFIHETLFSRLVRSSSNPYITNYWRGLYFCVSMLSRIYAKIKSSRIKSVSQ